jgi:hypothetical protein
VKGKTRESRYASKVDCPVGDVVFGGFAPSPMGAIRQTPEQAKEADEFWRKANEARAKASAKLREEIAGSWLENSEKILKEAIERVQRTKSQMDEANRRADASGDSATTAQKDLQSRAAG